MPPPARPRCARRNKFHGRTFRPPTPDEGVRGYQNLVTASEYSRRAGSVPKAGTRVGQPVFKLPYLRNLLTFDLPLQNRCSLVTDTRSRNVYLRFMPWGLKRFQEAKCLHFIAFSCHNRE